MKKKINQDPLLTVTYKTIQSFFMTIKMFLAKLNGDLRQCRFNPTLVPYLYDFYLLGIMQCSSRVLPSTQNPRYWF